MTDDCPAERAESELSVFLTGEEGSLWYGVLVSNVRRERLYSLHPRSPGVHSSR